MAETVYASFANPSDAERAAGALMDYGVRSEDLSVVVKDYADTRRDYAAHTATLAEPSAVGRAPAPYRSEDRAAEAGDRAAADVSGAAGATGTAANYQAAANERAADADYQPTATPPPGEWSTTEAERDRGTRDKDTAAKIGLSTTTPADAGSGAAKGAGIGLGLGILAALASVAVPGFGLVFGGGALALAIAGAAATTAAGAITGGVFGYLKDQGMPEQAARAYEQVYEQGGAILAVQTPSANVDRTTIEGILAKYGATSVNTYAAAA